MSTLIDHRLLPQQAAFVDSFVQRNDARTLLVAAPGTGKTLTARFAAMRMLAEGLVDRVHLVAGSRVLAEHWRHIFSERDSVPLEAGADAIHATTYAALSRDPERVWGSVPADARALFVFDEVEWISDRLEAIAVEALGRFPGSRALFLATTPPPLSVDAEFAFGLEFFGGDALEHATTRARLTRLAPSFGVLEKVQRRLITLDELNWRDFEKFLAGMLEAEGYSVQLMQGSKDGGVDVVAVKDLGEAGLFKSVWQAKKHRADRKVGLSLVRELADTRLEHGASKAIIATTSYLTKGALDRVQRDRFLLGKMDRQDLDLWITRTLRADC